MSSFFDEDDEPRRQPRGARGGSGGGVADQQTLMIRRIVAGVVAVLVLVLLAIVVNSCRNSQHESALKDYNREVSTIATESAQQVGSQFFQLLGQQAGQQPQDLQSADLELPRPGRAAAQAGRGPERARAT